MHYHAYSDSGKSGSSSDTMMIVAFGKSFSVSDPTPNKLIMNTLARAAIERDRAMEDGEEMQLLHSAKEQTEFVGTGGSRLNTIQRTSANAMSGGVGSKQKVTFEDIDGSSTLGANSPR